MQLSVQLHVALPELPARERSHARLQWGQSDAVDASHHASQSQHVQNQRTTSRAAKRAKLCVFRSPLSAFACTQRSPLSRIASLVALRPDSRGVIRITARLTRSPDKRNRSVQLIRAKCEQAHVRPTWALTRTPTGEGHARPHRPHGGTISRTAAQRPSNRTHIISPDTVDTGAQ